MKMKSIIYIIGVLVALSSCREIIEPSLEKEKVNIVTPQDTLFKTYTLNFTWDELENALKYQVKIVQLDSVTQLQYDILVDSVVQTNSFRYTFAPSYYQVWVRALNGSSNSEWTMKKIKVVRAALSQQKVVLTSPTHKKAYNLDNKKPRDFQLEWVAIPENGIKYKLEVDSLSGDFTKAKKYFPEASSQVIQTPVDGIYYWRVKAIQYDNKLVAIDSTKWSDRYYFTYDVTPPVIVTTPKPTDNQTNQNAQGKLYWVDNQKDVSYIVNIKYGDGAWVANPTNNKEFSYNMGSGTNKTVSWSVNVKDNAGNLTEGTIWSFTVQ